MLFKLALAFVVVPLVELVLLIEVGSRIGTLNTVGIIVLTGVVGAAAARAQGLGLVHRARRQLEGGEVPTASLIDGLFILAAGLLLITPGFLTDLAGFSLLVPGVRSRLREWIRDRLLYRLARGGTIVIKRKR